MSRIKAKFTELKQKGKTAFVGYICGGDPNYDISLKVLKSMPQAGVDIIELGVPFMDPAGDGPAIEEAAKRAIKSGATMKKILQMTQEFRQNDEKTPIVLMGYYNSFLKYGLDKIFADAEKNGADGVLIVDLPLEERDEIHAEISKTSLDFINLISPLSDKNRIEKIAKNASGFLYLVSMLGITGTKEAKVEDNIVNLQKIRDISNLEVVIGFGIKTPKQAANFAEIGVDGVVVGSEIVKKVAKGFLDGKNEDEVVSEAIALTKEFGDELEGVSLARAR